MLEKTQGILDKFSDTIGESLRNLSKVIDNSTRTQIEQIQVMKGEIRALKEKIIENIAKQDK